MRSQHFWASNPENTQKVKVNLKYQTYIAVVYKAMNLCFKT